MSKSGAYYNEFDPKAAAWLRELIKQSHIADGEVDERSIIDVAPDDVRGFTQCHWFAGLGGWSKALRFAGWPDDEPVWTGSPPCQPFSSAGQQRGSADERHLAPHFAELIASVRPAHVFGEQVASAAVFGKPAKSVRGAVASEPEWAWIDDLFGRLEAAHYACGASDIPAAGVGAPHLRQRAFFVGIRMADAGYMRWRNGAESIRQEQHAAARRVGDVDGVAYTASEGLEGQCIGGSVGARNVSRDGVRVGSSSSSSDGLADAMRIGQQGSWQVGRPGDPEEQGDWQKHRVDDAGGRSGMADATLEQRDGGGFGRTSGRVEHTDSGGVVGMEHPAGDGRESRRPEPSGRGIVGGRGDSGLEDALHAERRSVDVNGTDGRDGQDAGREEAHGFAGTRGEVFGQPSPLVGGWDAPDWLFCRDGKWRPVESSLFGLVDGLPAGMVRGGDIVPACYPLAQKGKTDTRRAMRLKGYGNAIVPQAAAVFIKSVMEITQ